MKIKVSEASPSQINYLVAKAHGAVLRQDGHGKCWLVDGALLGYLHNHWDPTTDWSQGGSIIDREVINHEGINPKRFIAWKGFNARRATWDTPADPQAFWQYGPTPLIAAMRCFVSSKLGNEVEVPDDLA